MMRIAGRVHVAEGVVRTREAFEGEGVAVCITPEVV
jgi:hypothetical protein